MDISGMGSGLPAAYAEYAVSLQRKALDQQQVQGQQAVQLIEAAGPQRRPPGPNSTISVVA